jgi:hypothetical protein
MMTVRRQKALQFLRARSADTVVHVGGTLLDHLVGTEELLRSWGCGEDLCLAGLCHAAYGTDGFGASLVSWTTRHVLFDAVGGDVEAIVYLYASCDRAAVYPRLAGVGPVVFRDRFTDSTFDVSASEIRDFVDLTLANELEIATGEDTGPAPWLADVIDLMGARASEGVRRKVHGTKPSFSS